MRSRADFIKSKTQNVLRSINISSLLKINPRNSVITITQSLSVNFILTTCDFCYKNKVNPAGESYMKTVVGRPCGTCGHWLSQAPHIGRSNRLSPRPRSSPATRSHSTHSSYSFILTMITLKDCLKKKTKKQSLTEETHLQIAVRLVHLRLSLVRRSGSMKANMGDTPMGPAAPLSGYSLWCRGVLSRACVFTRS